ncbi:CGNR zinc finger domain-containing protein [Microtetraspora sp. NBRC 13810]|uniref:CGNR zinc finger domain-containing protein n=1 Tax=Microtetraspora sp. NBRC 13810 TaxID=3030990 RepID=UPI0025531CCD|nr:CGNR zinc finger domain-containing protein [Microtetraspora sp. NBRC 13810]
MAVAVGLVNVLTPGERRGRPYLPPVGAEGGAEVTGTLRLAAKDAWEVSEPELAAFAEAAVELRAVFTAVDAGDIDAAARQVNRLMEENAARPHLDRHDGEHWHLHFHGAHGDRVRNWVASGATALAIVLGSDLYDRLGVCTAPACDRVYVDVSRNGTRRFCSTACQNRVKSAAFRARTAAR